MRHLFTILFSIFVVSLLIFTACSEKPIQKYFCNDPDNWSDPKCNPPICLEIRICTHDLYPVQYWKKVELQILPISYHRLKIQNFILKGGVEGLTLEQYINAQNLRYIQALNNNDQDLIDRLVIDADRVGYYLIPSKFLGGNSND